MSAQPPGEPARPAADFGVDSSPHAASGRPLHVSMFTSWQVRCGIADYASHLVGALQCLPATSVDVVPFDRQAHPRRDYVTWGAQLNVGDVAHIQHEYSFFGYLVPWQNYFDALAGQVRRPLVITRHVTFDGPLTVPGRGVKRTVRQVKWSLYNRWLGPYATYLNRDTFAVADQIIVLSGRLKGHLVQRSLDPTRIHVIPAGVPVVAPPAGGPELRARWGWPDKYVLGIFGYITPVKGHTLALQALAALPDDYTLLIAGGVRRREDRDVLAALEKEIRAGGLGNRVRITGYLEEQAVPQHVDACDLLLYPATHADSSYSLVTGIAYHRAPLIVSDIYGHREVAERGAGVALFRSGDVGDLAKVVRQLKEHPEAGAALIEQMKGYAAAFGWPAIAEQTRTVYIQALQTHRATATK